jgi:hypothetical protein
MRTTVGPISDVGMAHEKLVTLRPTFTAYISWRGGRSIVGSQFT